MPNVFQLMPSLEGDEMAYVQELIKDMTDSQAQQFAMAYMARRKDPSNILVFTVIGFIGIAGIQRFVLNQIGMGILFLLTGGLCVIGTIVDLVNFKKLSFEYNSKQAQQVAGMIKSYAS
ncbi:MAG: TM2 domain-containing protein [Ignavibacteriaceae bacterium]|jgi:TM2 domain-containing membrane protein YozV